MALKAVLINGSPRVGGNTQILLDVVSGVLSEGGIATEHIKIGGKYMRGCIACGRCKKTRDGKCALTDDMGNEVMSKMYESEIIVFGAPVYFGSAPAEMKALMDRAGYAGRPDMRFSRKIGGPLTVARKAGQNFTFAQMLYWFMINDMVVPGSGYWNVATARDAGEVEKDTEALGVAEQFGRNLVWLGSKLF